MLGRKAIGGFAALMFSAPAHVAAQLAPARDVWLSTSASARETFTTNTNLGSGGDSQSSFVTSLTGNANLRYNRPRLKLNGSASVTGVLYTGSDAQDSIYPVVALNGNVEAIEKFFYVDASASVSQTFVSPFGATPNDLTIASQNRYTSQVYRVSPYIQGRLGSDMSYLVRNDNIWSFPSTSSNTAAVNLGTLYSNLLTARLSSPPTPLGWTAEYTRNQLSYEDQARDSTLELARLIVPYQLDPQLQISARGGYESNQFPLTESSGSIYGAGIDWRPNQRTSVNGFWEERFFGSSYRGNASYRRPGSSFGFTLYRDISTFPQQVFGLPAGVGVAQALDAAFTTRIPDPVERAQAVNQFIAQNGLPTVVTSPLTYYTQRITLSTGGDATFSLIGKRNVVLWRVFNVTTEGIAGTGDTLPSQFAFAVDNTQLGSSLTYSHRLTPITSANATLGWIRTTATDDSSLRSTTSYAVASISSSLAAKTGVSAGVNYYIFDSITGSRSDSLGIFAAVTHNF